MLVFPLRQAYLETNEYLDYCYTLIVKKEAEAAVSSAIKCRSYLCSNHMLKLVIKHSKKVKIADDSIRNFFVLCFTLLINSINIEEFNSHLTDIYIGFCEDFRSTEVDASLAKLKLAIETRPFTNAEQLNIDDDEEFIPKVVLLSNCENQIIILQKTSAFARYYATFIKELGDSVKKRNEISKKRDLEMNKYKVDFFKNVEGYLFLMPMWLGIMINSLSIKH